MLCSRRDAEAAVAAAALRAAAAASIHQILTGLWLCGLSHRLCLQLTSKSLSHGQMKAKRALVVVATTEQLWNYFNRSSVTGVHMCVSVCGGGGVCVYAHTPQSSRTAPRQAQPLKLWFKEHLQLSSSRLWGLFLTVIGRETHAPRWFPLVCCRQHEVCASLSLEQKERNGDILGVVFQANAIYL